MSELTLYHGSGEIVKQPLPGAGRKHNDFGQGFYCTENVEPAKEWACTQVHGGYVNKYFFDGDGLQTLYLNRPEYTILNWMAILVNHRVFRIKTPVAGRAKRYLTDHFNVNVALYDVIVGYRADDSYYDFADAFLNNAITVEQLALAMRLGKLGEQVVLKSGQAFERIRFDSAEAVDAETYFPKRKMRDETAAADYRRLTQTEEDGLYMVDIMRQEVKNDDSRIPRNVS